MRSEGPPPPARPPLPAARREGAWEEAQLSGNQGHRAAVWPFPILPGGEARGYAKEGQAPALPQKPGFLQPTWICCLAHSWA